MVLITEPTQYYAHSLQGQTPSNWEPLESHLLEVAGTAEKFAAKFNSGAWGQLAGLWHDLGKYSPAFQSYLRRANGFEAHLEEQTRVDHSTAGAQHANQAIPGLGGLLAYIIAGHHSGLADALSLDGRLRKEIDAWEAPQHLLQAAPLGDPALSFDRTDRQRSGFQLAFFTRMVFSSLVDADFLATERFMDRGRSVMRERRHPPLEGLTETLARHLDELTANAPPNFVNERRAEVLSACRSAATLPPGVFSLTVPTGGGKTLASLDFALRHALLHKLDRVIYAIPFTSIIEQTADVFRDAFASFGPDVVLEHHSNLDARRETPQSRLAAENWDAPLIVTTSIQLFESLFANRTSSCRKLHNLVRSVIVLDEAQTLPVELLRPCLAALRELVTDYRVSVVLCTATRPALDQRDDFPIGLKGVREIIPAPQRLYQQLKRVEVVPQGDITNVQLAEWLANEQQTLCIVNTRRHAFELFRLLQEKLGDDDGLIHLSTLMCGQHRADALKVVRQRLAASQPCRVVSTQLIEAGVDVDFPAVYRALAGLDSVAQAAGRCNREGRLKIGRLRLFSPIDNPPPLGYIRSCCDSAAEIIPDFADDLLQPAAIEAYFQLHYWNQCRQHEGDKAGVMRQFPPSIGRRIDFNFRSAADAFRMIDDSAEQVFVPYDQRAERFLSQLRAIGPTREVMRGLQRYTVGVFTASFQSLIAAGDIEIIDKGFAVLVNDNAYDRKVGVRLDRPGYREPDSLII